MLLGVHGARASIGQRFRQFGEFFIPVRQVGHRFTASNQAPMLGAFSPCPSSTWDTGTGPLLRTRCPC